MNYTPPFNATPPFVATCTALGVPEILDAHNCVVSPDHIAYLLNNRSIVEWVPVSERLPEVPLGEHAEFIVAVRRKGKSKVWVFSANYLNGKKLLVEDYTDEEDEFGRPFTGWYDELNCNEGDYDSEWTPTLNAGDELLAWWPLPAPKAAGMLPTPPVQAIARGRLPRPSQPCVARPARGASGGKVKIHEPVLGL